MWFLILYIVIIDVSHEDRKQCEVGINKQYVKKDGLHKWRRADRIY